MPLIYHGQLKQHNEGRQHVVKVVAAVVVGVECGFVQCIIATVKLVGITDIVAMVTNQAMEYLHSNDSEKVIKDLKNERLRLGFTFSRYGFTETLLLDNK